MIGRRPIIEDAPEVGDYIIASVSEGVPMRAAAGAVGIDPSTLFDWLAKGREANKRAAAGEELNERERLYANFADRMTRARYGGAEALFYETLDKAKHEKAGAAVMLKLLQVRYPDLYTEPGARRRLEEEVEAFHGPEAVERLHDEREELEREHLAARVSSERSKAAVLEATAAKIAKGGGYFDRLVVEVAGAVAQSASAKAGGLTPDELAETSPSAGIDWSEPGGAS